MKKQSASRGIWCIGSERKRRRQKDHAFLIVALPAPIIGPIGSVAIKILFGCK